MVRELSNQTEAMQDIDKNLQSAYRKRKFLVAVFELKEDEEGVQVRRVTWDFPSDKLPDCLDVLKKDLMPELSSKITSPEPEPLPRDTPFSPPSVKDLEVSNDS